MKFINIVKQASPSCRGEHADPEGMFDGRTWQWTDIDSHTPILETLECRPGESSAEFSDRASRRADEIDRKLDCYRCYHR